MRATPSPERDPVSVPALARMGAGTAAVLLGIFPMLAALDLIDTEGGIEPFARVVALLFGAVFVAIGGWLVGGPFMALARARGTTDWREALVLGARHLLLRPTWTSAGAATGVAVLALGYWLAVIGVDVPLLGGRNGLEALVGIEFLVIHGFPFLVIAAVFTRNTRGRARLVAGGALGLLLTLYCAMAWKAADGVGGLVGLLYLIMPNVLAFLGAESPHSGRVLVTSRWVIKFALFMLTTAVVGGGSFSGPRTILLGAVYFTLMAGVELFRVVEVPGEVAASGWAVERMGG